MRSTRTTLRERAAIRVLLLSVALLPLRAAEGPKSPAITEKNYVVFRKDGSAASVDDIVNAASKANVTFLGESHDDPVAHFLELEILKRIASGHTVLALEMFERDTQHVVNEYLAGIINEKYLIADGRAWKNYKTDYRPLIEFAKERKMQVLAANAPARYVNRVSRLGPESLQTLDEEARKSLPPLPYANASPAYAENFRRLMGDMGKETGEATKKKRSTRKKDQVAEAASKSMTHPDMQYALEAQSLWDATMAYSIATKLNHAPDSQILQINGVFHSEHRLGILDHLHRYRPDTSALVITMEPDKAFPHWDSQKQDAGDFVILTDPSVPRSSFDSSGVPNKKEKHKKQKHSKE